MQQYNKTLYKKDTKGKIRYLNVIADYGDLIQISGVVGTSNPVTHESACYGKNIGKANETNSVEQAVLEAKSKISDKLTTGYFETLEEAESETVVLPMLAKDYNKEMKKIQFPCYVQPKLDGMRCMIIIEKGQVRLVSRTGKDIETMGHIQEEVRRTGIINLIMDGELYVHGETFQENMRLIKKYRPGKSEKVMFRWYDVIEPKSFVLRNQTLKSHYEHLFDEKRYINLVKTVPVESFARIKQYHSEFLNDGYEGTMVRWGDDGYKIAGRSSNLLKYKDFLDETYTVVDVKPSDKDPEMGVVVCKVPNVGTFGCGMKFSHAERREILANKANYIGKTAEIRFFEYTDDGLPRFPVCVGFRLDK